MVQVIVSAAYEVCASERVSLYLVDSIKQELWTAVSKARGALAMIVDWAFMVPRRTCKDFGFPSGRGLRGQLLAPVRGAFVPRLRVVRTRYRCRVVRLRYPLECTERV